MPLTISNAYLEIDMAMSGRHYNNGAPDILCGKGLDIFATRFAIMAPALFRGPCCAEQPKSIGIDFIRHPGSTNAMDCKKNLIKPRNGHTLKSAQNRHQETT
ncbi:hypothetical protein DBV23_16260 [Edwardsiella ictaluri]|nr:hypothetical protein B6E78_03435 [Edwardsiella ictaluri]AVZ83612.1 hypothetical protein DBV23_16260 [Edwardsiella ictaluri]